MNAFRMYLWKELREQRAAVVALAIVLPALVLTISASMPKRILGDATFTASVMAMALATTLVAVGGELLTPDRRARGQWLERLPGGLPAAFPAKLLVFGTTTVVALAFGFALGLLGTFLEGREVLAKACSSILETDRLGGVLVVGLVTGCWTFAASAWCPRGMLSLCAGALLAGALGFPLWLHQRARYSPEHWEVVAAVALLLVGALVSAWCGFVHGQRLGRPGRSTLLRGAAAGILCALPLPAWGALQLHERDTFRLRDAEIGAIRIVADGSKALVHAWGWSERWGREHPSGVIVADLERGTWRRVGAAGSELEEGWAGDPGPVEDPDRFWVRLPDRPETTVTLSAVDGRVLVSENGDLAEPGRTLASAGQGWTFWGEEGRELVDPQRGIAVSFRALGLDWSDECFVGPSGWIVARGTGSLEYSEGSGLLPAPWLEGSIVTGPMLADGRLLVYSRDCDSWALADPSARTLERIDGEIPVPLRNAFGRDSFQPHEPVLMYGDDDETYVLDVRRLELRRTDESYAGIVLRALPDGSLFLGTDDGIFRRDPVTGARTLVFSFADAREEEALEP